MLFRPTCVRRVWENTKRMNRANHIIKRDLDLLQVIINLKYANGNILLPQETVNVISVRVFDPCYLGSRVRERWRSPSRGTELEIFELVGYRNRAVMLSFVVWFNFPPLAMFVRPQRRPVGGSTYPRKRHLRPKVLSDGHAL